MKFTAVVAGLLASLAVAAPAEKVENELRPRLDYSQSTDCIHPKDGFHLVSLGGEYTTVGNLSLLATLAEAVLAIAPGSKMYQIGYTEGALAPQDITEGIPAFRNHLLDYFAKCPKTKVVTIGYSVGATIVMDTLCGDPRDPQAYDAISSDFRENILANVVYGDLTFVSGQRSARGTCDSGEGVVPRAFPGQCYPYGRKTVSYCDVNDPQCCTRGGDPEIHFTYPNLYDADAAQFVKAKWNYFKRNN